MSDIPVAQSSEYESALRFINAIRCSCGSLQREQLPVKVRVGRSQFILTEDNFELIALGVLMAALWEEKE